MSSIERRLSAQFSQRQERVFGTLTILWPVAVGAGIALEPLPALTCCILPMAVTGELLILSTYLKLRGKRLKKP